MNHGYTQRLIAGVDEAGRGPLVGAVIAAAVILDPHKPIFGLTDSKKLSEKKREFFYEQILTDALSVGVGRAEAAEIDQINISQATLLAMKRAVDNLQIEPTMVIVDGRDVPVIDYPAEAIVKGDLTEAAISAASIIAKVSRDREMYRLDQKYPGYGLAQHKGYPTKAHLEALQRLGPTPLHRRSFGPVKSLLK